MNGDKCNKTLDETLAKAEETEVCHTGDVHSIPILDDISNLNAITRQKDDKINDLRYRLNQVFDLLTPIMDAKMIKELNKQIADLKTTIAMLQDKEKKAAKKARRSK